MICLCERVGRLAEPWVRPRRFGGRDRQRGAGRAETMRRGGRGGGFVLQYDYKMLYYL